MDSLGSSHSCMKVWNFQTSYSSVSFIIERDWMAFASLKCFVPMQVKIFLPAFHFRIPEMVGSIHSLLQAYGQMLFVDGVFHADPHAGNLLLLLDGRLGLLDYGQCKVLDAETRLKLAKIVLALSDNDDVEIARALLDAEMVFENITGDDISVSDFSTVARILFDVSYVEEATVSPTAQNSILRRTPLKSFNRALWLVVRAIFILRGLCFMLKIDTSAATIWRPYALVALQEKHS